MTPYGQGRYDYKEVIGRVESGSAKPALGAHILESGGIKGQNIVIRK